MAHERLRFNINLKEKNEDNNNLITNTSYDPIYSDIKYNTHFSVFANFTGKKNNDGFRVDSINFLIQNYTGDITIGLKKVIGINTDGVIDDSDEYFVPGFSTGKHIKIFVQLQAINTSKKFSYNEESIQFNQGDFVEVITLIEPIDNSISKIDESNEERNRACLFVDSEYMHRDGEEIVVNKKASAIKELLELIEAHGYSAIPLNSAGEIDFNINELRPGRRCKMKVSDVYID